jgi:DNA-binding NarL/FixJ family response regulator
MAVDGKVTIGQRVLNEDQLARFGVTPAERRVLEVLVCGDTVRGIATRLGLSYSTVKTQLGTLRLKTTTQSRGELMVLFTTPAQPAEHLRRIA